MLVRVKDIATEDTLNARMFFFACRDTLKGYIEEEHVSTDGDGNIYNVIFKINDLFYRLMVTRYEQAGFSDLGEQWKVNEDLMVNVDRVERKEVTTWKWVRV